MFSKEKKNIFFLLKTTLIGVLYNNEKYYYTYDNSHDHGYIFTITFRRSG